MKRIEREIEEFVHFKSKLHSAGHDVVELDEFGFFIRGRKVSDRIQLLVTGLVHGDEVIGVEIMNRLLRLFCEPYRLDINMGFLLCNPDAAFAETRFIECDLNRSFCVDHATKREHRRAAEISKIVDLADFVFDLHQTSEPSVTPFFVMAHDPWLIELAHDLLPQYPIVTFNEAGFSRDGKTILEYAARVKTRAFVLECGQRGFSAEVADVVAAACLKLARTAPVPDDAIKKDRPISVCHLVQNLYDSGGTRLIDGLSSCAKVSGGQIVGYTGETPVCAPFDGMIIFPTYSQNTKAGSEICNFGIELDYRDTFFTK